MVVTAFFHTSSLINFEQRFKKSGIFSVTTILKYLRSTDIKGQLILKASISPNAVIFSKVASFSQLLRGTIFCLK